MSDSSAFQLLHDGVRRQIYKMGWTELRPMQTQAIRCILGTDGHVILSAGTASGKTEAAFFPVLSAIAEEAVGSIRAIYVGPLKALINDQFSRVEELCGYLDVPVHRWHGDVSASAKAKLIKDPGGVLLITPESLESLFVNRSNALSKLFRGLRFVVIDELHSFLNNERGLQLRSLLYRAAARTERPLRLVGLSATIGDKQAAIEYLDRDRPNRVQLIEGDKEEAELKVRIHAYVIDDIDATLPTEETATDDAPEYSKQMASDLVEHCRGFANLIFANARNDVEYFSDLTKRLAAIKGLPDLFLVHHGSLSADLRKETEETMKESSVSSRPATTFCSSTLEMGIDIGSVRMVGQIGAPHSVAALKQRVGRSGRRKGTPRILRGYLRCRSVDNESSLFDRLHLPLIQTIAIVELLLQHWVEPAETLTFDLSTLTQQIISVIAETGGAVAKETYEKLCQSGAFREVRPTDFAALLRQLGAADVIEQTPEGDLILGLIGEDIRKDKGFYATFMTSDAFAVFHDGQRIGSVDRAPEIKQHMILAGRRWQVVDVDNRQHVIYVVPARGWKPAPFAGGGGALHARVVAEMRSVLHANNRYAYLNPIADSLLNDARQTAAATGICNKRLISLDAGTTAFLPWIGSRTLDTVLATFRASGIEAVGKHQIAILLAKPIAACPDIFQNLSLHPPGELRILDALIGPPPAKYDSLLSDDLVRESRKRRWLDLPLARESIYI